MIKRQDFFLQNNNNNNKKKKKKKKKNEGEWENGGNVNNRLPLDKARVVRVLTSYI